MPSKLCFSFILIVFFAFLLPVTAAQAAEDTELSMLTNGQPTVACTLKAIDDKEYSFPTEGRWNVVFFWSLFCQSCIEELPLVQEKLKTAASGTFDIFFISLDTARMKKALINFTGARGFEYPVLLEQVASGSYYAADKWGVKTTPSIFIVAPDGKVAFSHCGEADIDQLFRTLSELSGPDSCPDTKNNNND